MTHDELRTEIYKALIDRGCYPNNLGWMTKVAAILTERTGRKISRISISHALRGRDDRRGPTYQLILNDLYALLKSRETIPLSGIIHKKTPNAKGI